MAFIKSIKDRFNALGKKEYTFENGGKTATVKTNDMLIASSYSLSYDDHAGNRGTDYRLNVGSNVTAEGVRKAKDFCGIT